MEVSPFAGKLANPASRSIILKFVSAYYSAPTQKE